MPTRRTSQAADLERLIEPGTGVLNPPATSPDQVKDFESRQSSWAAARPYIDAFEKEQEINCDLLRFAVLRLTDLAVIAHRTGGRTPVRLKTIVQHLNSPPPPPGEDKVRPNPHHYTLLHARIEKLGPQRSRKVSGRPPYTEVLSVLSALAWYVHYETERPHLSLLAQLLKCVYPPIFILRGSRQAQWRQLSEAIRKYRGMGGNKDGEQDHEALNIAMAQALEALKTPSPR